MFRVIVVDDERSAVEALRRLLVLDGYQVQAFDDPEAARKAIESAPFDAVVTDLEMPGVHGVEIIRAARRAKPGAPVFVVTAYADSPACRVAAEAGATAVLGKPLDYDALADALATSLARVEQAVG